MKKYFALAACVAAAFVIVRAQETAALPIEAEATVRAATSQNNPDLLDQAAAGYTKLYKYDVAQTLLVAALALRGEISGEQSGSFATGLVKLGDLAVARRQFDAADQYYARAIALGDRAETTPALLYMGIKAYRAKNYLAAEGFLERIVAIDPKGPKAGPALMWLGNVRQRNESFIDNVAATLKGQPIDPQMAADAQSFYQRALAVEDPHSFDAVDTMRNYASLLRRMGRLDEAAAMEAASKDAHPQMSAAKPMTNGVYRVGNGVTAPALLLKTEPEYTQE